MVAWRIAIFVALIVAVSTVQVPARAAEAPAHDKQAAEKHGEAASHATGGHQEGKADPLEWRKDLSFWTLIVFLFLFGVLWKFAWGPIAEGLDKREHGIAEQIAAAHRANEEAKGLLGQYEAKLAAAQGEVRAIVEEARRDAEHTQQEILAKANAEAQASRERAKREIETATAQALKELAQRSANLAVELAGKIVSVQLKPGDHARLIEDAVARFPEMKPSEN